MLNEPRIGPRIFNPFDSQTQTQIQQQKQRQENLSVLARHSQAKVDMARSQQLPFRYSAEQAQGATSQAALLQACQAMKAMHPTEYAAFTRDARKNQAQREADGGEPAMLAPLGKPRFGLDEFEQTSRWNRVFESKRQDVEYPATGGKPLETIADEDSFSNSRDSETELR